MTGRALPFLLVALTGCGESVRHEGGAEANGAAAGAGAGAGAGGATSTATPPDWVLGQETDTAVAYLNDPAHSGAQLDTAINPPLRLAWAQAFPGGVSYPLIAQSRVFLTANDADAPRPTLYALELETGAVAWQVALFATASEPTSAGLAYDRGRVFAADRRGHVAAFDTATGSMLWSTTLDGGVDGSYPVAAGGAVYVVLGTSTVSYLYALNELDGSLVYLTPSPLGEPTLGNRMIFSTAGCAHTMAFAMETGQVRWDHQEGCSGNGDRRSGYWLGYLFTSEGSPPIQVLDTVSGGVFRTLAAPTVSFPMTFGTAPHAIEIVDPVVTGRADVIALMRYSEFVEPDRSLALSQWSRLPLLATQHFVYALFAADDRAPAFLTAFDLDAGAAASQVSEQNAFPADPDWLDDSTNPYPGMAAGAGRIVVAEHREVVAYRPVLGD